MAESAHTTRRGFIKSASVFLAAPTTIGVLSIDPVVNALRAYRAALDDFNKNAPDDNDGAEAYAALSYGPHLERLSQWNEPATTMEGAVEALRAATTDDGGVYGCEAADRMIMAALRYLETLTI